MTNFNIVRTPTLAIAVCISSLLFALEPKYNIVPDQLNTAIVPFNTVNNLIVCKIRINDSDTLNFILDSGAKNTILFLPDASNNPLNLTKVSSAYLRGIGWERDSIRAYMSKNNTIYLPGVEGKQVDIAYLMTSDFDISAYLGSRIDGIIGSDIFQQLVVRINYSRNEILFHNPGTAEINKKYAAIPLDIDKGKAYVTLPVTIGLNKINARLLLDLGESKPLNLIPFSDPKLTYPEKFTMASLGVGLNGAISGYIARINSLKLGHYLIEDVITSFPDEISLPNMHFDDHRQGSLGAGILERFECVIDFPAKTLYLKRTGNLNKPFPYNRLGAELIAEGKDYSTFIISNIIPLTPADIFGLTNGDEIIAVNGRRTKNHTIDEIWRWINNENLEFVSLKYIHNGHEYELNVHLFDIL